MTERNVGRPWTAEEDRLLANAVAIHGESDNWKAVAHCVPERTNKACRKRWLHSLSPNVKKSAWTPEEDHLLLELFKVHSTKWSVIARHIPGRTDDACSKRYREALDPSLRRDEWSKDEDDKLFDAYSRLAGRWGQVGQELQRSGLACRNRWRLLERKRHNLTEPQGVAVSKLSLTMSSQPSSPMSPYTDPTPWPPPPMPNPRQYWSENLSQFDGGPSPASGQHHSHVRSHNDVGLMGSVEPSVSHPQSIQHVVNLPPPFHYSSSSLSSALSSPHTLSTRYEKSTAAPSNSYQTGEAHAAPHSITSVPPAENASTVFDYGVVIDPSLVNATRATDYAAGHHPLYEDHVTQHQYDEIQRSVAPTPVLSHTPVPAQRASEYYSPVPRHNECHHQLIRDGEVSASQVSRDSCYPTASQGSSAALVPTALSLTHEATDSYYVAHHRQQLEHDVQHFVMSSPDSSSVCSVPREYFPSSSSSDNCSPVSPIDGALRRTPCNQYYPPSDHVVATHQDISSMSRSTTTAPEVRGDYYQPHFHSLSNESKLNGHQVPMPVTDTGPSPTVSPNFHPAPSAQRSASASSSAYTHLCTTTVLPKAMGTKRGPPQDNSSPNPDDPNPRPTARSRQSFVRKRADIHAPLRLSSDLPATKDPSIKPYACGHESCWPVAASSSLACFITSRGLSDHNKCSHPEDSGGERPYRCGLEGCGKSWKSINGLQYHLQISKAHFQHAIVSTFVTSYIDGLTVPPAEASTGEGDDKTKKQYSCPHQGCPNRYKQLSGLRYHLTHGHPTDLPVQLDLVPPALSRKLAEKMRKDGAGSLPPETQTHKALLVPAPSQSCSPGRVPA
ncbi:hypothetical protein CY34DRAFT_796967 [Suillus luteus UH-Slu-Lm8-n1]|uniref:Transcriptional activator Myb n=1 Tax=Suillus luteus UH-Slu-Lm8-n1 TaxID=930992 RepID=A0A0D0BJ61_9AGAM|nr:hypothetical protein CY34DRAFT_796967 [Suillus luteus UH-Slu-Lm8-n1]